MTAPISPHCWPRTAPSTKTNDSRRSRSSDGKPLVWTVTTTYSSLTRDPEPAACTTRGGRPGRQRRDRQSSLPSKATRSRRAVPSKDGETRVLEVHRAKHAPASRVGDCGADGGVWSGVETQHVQPSAAQGPVEPVAHFDRRIERRDRQRNPTGTARFGGGTSRTSSRRDRCTAAAHNRVPRRRPLAHAGSLMMASRAAGIISNRIAGGVGGEPPGSRVGSGAPVSMADPPRIDGGVARCALRRVPAEDRVAVARPFPAASRASVREAEERAGGARVRSASRSGDSIRAQRQCGARRRMPSAITSGCAAKLMRAWPRPPSPKARPGMITTAPRRGA